jgi:hypothetical protein
MHGTAQPRTACEVVKGLQSEGTAKFVSNPTHNVGVIAGRVLAG